MYSPKIKEDLVRKLYKLKHSDENKTPMTKLVNEAVSEYLERKVIQNEQKEAIEDSSQSVGDGN